MRTMFLVFLCSLIFGASESAANVSDRRTATWNMQGSCANGESKWVTAIPNLMVGSVAIGDRYRNVGVGLAVLALQEAGTPPPITRQVPQGQQPPVTQNGNIAPQFLRWRPGRRFDDFYLYYLRTDPGANRCNIAFLTTERVDEVITLPPPHNQGREILGIRMGNDFYFTIHARSRVPGDAMRNVQAIYDFMAANHAGREFMIMGDFNEEPGQLQRELLQYPNIQPNVVVVYEDRPTHQGGRTLDYAVIGRVPTQNQPVLNLPAVVATPSPGIANVGPSDHWAKIFSEL